LGEGKPQELSADGAWVLAIPYGKPNGLQLIPTGAGATKTIPVEGVEPRSAWFLPNGRGFVIRGAFAGGDASLFVVSPDGGKARALPAEGFRVDRDIVVSPEGSRFAYMTKDGHIRVVPFSGGEAATVPGVLLDYASALVQWSSDRDSVYVLGGGLPGRVDRVDIATGRRESWRSLMPDDPVGAVGIISLVLTPDGQHYAYSYGRVETSQLFVVQGIR
jgi:hypothetical protein